MSDSNHVIIGLGGTGGRVVRAMRKLMFQEFGVPDPKVAGGLKLAYLYVDSSDEMMAFDDPTWKVLGSSVQLGSSSQLLIRGGNLTAMLDNITGFPGIAPWIGSAASWRDILGGTVGDVLGGQKRRLGRFLLACQAHEFRKRLQAIVGGLENVGEQGCTFHVCCGLAGGTGSGSIADAVALIRSKYQNEKSYRIRIYAYLPEEHPKANWNTGNYHANGYAALRELNSMNTGNWVPHDISGEQHRHDQGRSESGRYVASSFRSPFTGCYLYTNVNANGVQLDVEAELPRMVADFLFQKIVFTRALGDGRDSQTFKNIDNVENRSDTAEVMEGSNQKLRTKQFLTFGMKRIVIPEDEIHEYLAFNFAHQGTMQLLYNNWREDFGYIDEPKPSDMRELVARPETQDKWRMSDEHLMLSKGILDVDAQNSTWKPLQQEWTVLAAPFKDAAKNKAPHEWLDGLEKMYTDRFNDTFRRLGVKRFYETKDKSRTEMARAIRARVEQHIMEQLINASMSLADARLLLEALIEGTRDRADGFNARRQKESEREAQDLQDVQGNKAKWAAAGVLVRKMRGVAFVDAQSVNLEKMFSGRTRVAALEFAAGLAKTLVQHLEDLKNELQRFTTTVSESGKSFKALAAAKCADDGQMDFKRTVVRFYDPKVVREINNEFKINATLQRSQTSAIRSAMAAVLGSEPSFQKVNEVLSRQRFVEVLEERCAQSAKDAHEALATENRSRRVMGVNIIDKLAERYDGDADGLKRFVRDLVESSGVFVKFNEEQISLSGVPSVPVSARPTEVFMVLRPNPASRGKFVEQFDHTFKQFSGGHEVIFVDIEQSDAAPAAPGVGDAQQAARVKPRTNVIAVVRLANCFPLRYLNEVKMLKEKYLQRVLGHDPARARLEVYMEGDGEQHPDLFVESLTATVDKTLPNLMIGWAGGLTHFDDDAKQHEIPFQVNGVDQDPLRLGADLNSAMELLTYSSCKVVNAEVSKLLSTKYETREKRVALQKAVADLANTFRKNNGGSFDNLGVKRVNASANRAVELLNA